jgi:hypothetical protein
LAETGLTSVLEQAESIIGALEQEGASSLRHGKSWSYSYEHPLLGGGPLWGTLIQEEDSADPEKQPKRAVAETVFKHFASRLVADARTANTYGIPLGTSFHSHSPTVPMTTPGPAVAEHEVAMNLKLPFLDGMPLRELMQLRSDESLAFDRFRMAVRKAINERITAAKTATNARSVAQQIERDLVEPSLLDIETKLKAAKKVFEKKTTYNLGMATIATAIGLLADIPFMLPSGLAVAMSSVHYGKYLDDVKEVKLSEMYFLWDAQGRLLSQ